MRKNSIAMGFFFVGLAIVIMLSSLGFIPHIPWFKLICSVAIGSWGLKALMRRDFFGMTMSASIIAWFFEEELMIEEIAPFPLCAAAALLGLGLNMIFGKRPKVISIRYKDDNEWKEGSLDDISREEWTSDGRHVTLENTFNSTSKYVNAAAFSTADLENNFGSANVYFSNATIANGEATVNLENNFGKMNIYLPNTWRATITQENTFGHVGIFGEPNRDMDAPHVIVKAETNFGDISIFFD